MNTDRFQGKCLVNAEGYRFMTGFYDYMPPEAREKLRNSRFNICAACVREEALRLAGDNFVRIEHYLKAIRNIEAQLS